MANIFNAIVIVCSVIVFIILLLLFFVLLYRKSHNSFLNEKELMEARFEQILLQSEIEVKESTQSYMAKELHDNIGQLISSAKMLIGVARRTETEHRGALDKADETLADAIRAVRGLSKSMDREWVEKFNLLENLASEKDRINEARKYAIRLHHPGKISMGAEHQLILFRVMQEALQNIIKHADASKIEIRITEDNAVLEVCITDDGKGLAVNQQRQEGMGIRNIDSRIKALCGQTDWQSQPGKGTTLHITIPIKPR